jgi:thiamine-phosphate pyrophosphorylase
LKSIDFYFITDSGLSKSGIIDDVNQALKAGCKIIQYREKAKKNLEEAIQLRKLCNESNAIFLINDDVQLAIDVDADGVHLGRQDMKCEEARKALPDRIIGLTVHDEKEAMDAEKTGADYIGLSPIFATSTKKDAGIPCGIPMIAKVRRKTNLPIVAIGGITKENLAGVIRAGADSAVAISAVLKGDVKKNVEEFIRIMRENKL